jgi:hypothetical protein
MLDKYEAEQDLERVYSELLERSREAGYEVFKNALQIEGEPNSDQLI